MSSLNMGGATSNGSDHTARMHARAACFCPACCATPRVIASQARHNRRTPTNAHASSTKSSNPAALATAPPSLNGGVPKNQAPGTLKENGDPGSDAARLTSVVPSNPTKQGRPYRPKVEGLT